MNQYHTQINIVSSENLISADDKTLLINKIQEQHQLILHKLLPEIDMHFVAVLENDAFKHHDLIQEAHQAFGEFSELLADHIYMEDEFVLPELSNNDPIILKAIVEFIEKHDDFEHILQDLLTKIEHSLLPLKPLLSFRMLCLKMERLQSLLEEHNQIEDQLFAGTC